MVLGASAPKGSLQLFATVFCIACSCVIQQAYALALHKQGLKLLEVQVSRAQRSEVLQRVAVLLCMHHNNTVIVSTGRHGISGTQGTSRGGMQLTS